MAMDGAALRKAPLHLPARNFELFFFFLVSSSSLRLCSSASLTVNGSSTRRKEQTINKKQAGECVGYGVQHYHYHARTASADRIPSSIRCPLLALSQSSPAMGSHNTPGTDSCISSQGRHLIAPPRDLFLFASCRRRIRPVRPRQKEEGPCRDTLPGQYRTALGFLSLFLDPTSFHRVPGPRLAWHPTCQWPCELSSVSRRHLLQCLAPAAWPTSLCTAVPGELSPLAG